MESIKLTNENLSKISKPVSVPSYNRKDLSPSIVHIGLGNFHRAHQAMYLDQLLEAGLEKTGIFGINLIPEPSSVKEKSPPGVFPVGRILEEQDHLYTLITKSAEGEEKIRVIGSLLGYLNASSRGEEALRRVAADGTALVTLTVTEKGYYYNRKTGEADTGNPAVTGDLKTPERPATAAGFLARALYLRYRESKSPLTIMSCDNIPSNGKVLKNCILFFCGNLYPEILSWVEDRVSFPCSMVDRITPVTTRALIAELETNYGIKDNWPVCGEDFRQWVLEDHFMTKVPPYGEAGVQIVKDVEPYELMKMRLLNGAHCAMACPSYLLGLRRVDEGIKNPLIREFIREHFMEEVTPTLSPVPGIDLEVYKDTLISRFSNVNIGDTLLRLTQDGSSRIPNFILKSLSDAIRAGLPHRSFIFALAAWSRFLEKKDEQGLDIPMDDVNAGVITEAAAKAGEDPGNFLHTLGLRDLGPEQFGKVIGEFKTQLDLIHGRGMKAALELFLKR